MLLKLWLLALIGLSIGASVESPEKPAPTDDTEDKSSDKSSAKKQWYDTFKGVPITDEEYEKHVQENNTQYCVIQVEKCKKDEGRRLDNTCNNLKHPTRGASLTPTKRLLDPVYSNEEPTGFEPRKAKDGKPLPLARAVRTHMLAEGKLPSQNFTHLLTDFWIFLTLDCTQSPDTVNYVITRPYCCLEEGKKDTFCAPNYIPIDDPVHRFSDVKCINMTRPVSFQNQACTANDTAPDRVNIASPPFDLSFLYGNTLSVALAARKNESGLLRFEEDDAGRIWPPSIKDNPKGLCRLNEEPAETRCHDAPVAVANTLLGANLLLVWLWRQHNMIATELAKANPSWSDEKLFNTARDINIAICVQILYYELYPLMMGRERMIKDKLIVKDGGFRDIYDEKTPPFMTYEYLYSLRWVHTIQEGAQKMYDTKGNYLKQIPVSNLTFRTGYFSVDDNIDWITQGVFRQACAAHDYVVDPDVSEQSLGPLQRSLDLLVNDLAKARFFGLQPYVKYLELCNGKKYKSWEDLAEFIDEQRIEVLQDLYGSVEDMELLAGIWVERPMKGAVIPPTMYCLTSKQLLANVKTDRHWYEREKRPNAFTKAQLAEIRKASVARLMCDVGDKVTEIQPHAFLRPGPGNKIDSCEKIAKIDFSVWKSAK